MTENERVHLRTVRAALEPVGVEGLLQAAAVAPAPAARLLRAVADALRAPDPDAALLAVMGEAGALQVEGGLAGLDALARQLVAPTRAGLAAAREVAAGLETERSRLSAQAEGLSATEGPLGDVLRRATAMVRDDAAFAPILGAIGQAEGLARLAETVVADARRDPRAAEVGAARLASAVQELEATLAAAEKTPWAAATGLVAELEVLAGDRSESAELAFLRAGWAEAEKGLGDAGVQTLWGVAFEKCLRFDLLPLTRIVAQRLQAVAMDAGDLRAVATIAHRVADNARDLDEVRVEVLARSEEALVLARLGLGKDARAMATDMVERSVHADAPTRARAMLVLGQVLLATAGAPAAREVWRRVMRTFAEDRACIDELGRTALELGRSQLAAGQDAQATENLRFACDVARVRADGMLYGPALAHLVQAHRLRGDGPGVEAILAEAREWLPRLVGAGAFEVFEAAVAAT